MRLFRPFSFHRVPQETHLAFEKETRYGEKRRKNNTHKALSLFLSAAEVSKWVNYIPKLDSLKVYRGERERENEEEEEEEDEFCFIVFGISHVVPVALFLGIIGHFTSEPCASIQRRAYRATSSLFDQ